MLSIENLSIAFNQETVLKNLSFTISKGESVGIVGESGSGKSITALSIMGLLPQSAKITTGKIILKYNNQQQIDLVRANSEQHRKVRGKIVSMIFQEPMTSLNPSMRCGEQVVEALILHNSLKTSEAKQKCITLFEEMMLPNPLKVFTSYPHQLSGGQKQRVMIAMALAGNPLLLIADEPTTALDVTVQQEIIGLLKRIVSQRSMSLIFISHDLGVVKEISERLIVLKDGEMVEIGQTSTLLSNPKHNYTKGLIKCRPPMDSRPFRLHTIQDFVDKNDWLPSQDKAAENITNTQNLIPTGDPLLHISNLSVSYITKKNFWGNPKEQFFAVNNLNVDLYPNETLGLVGESGCGKTTLGRAILGLTPIANGEILYKGNSLINMTRSEIKQFRQEVQLVFQDPFSSLNPRHTIGQMLMEPIKFYNLASGQKALRQRAMEMLEMVSMPTDSFYRYPHEFSGGQRQRIAIARALTVNPKVLVCDEMVSALDVSIQAHILNLLNRLKRDLNLTYLFISHDLTVVKYMSNRILVMYKGEIVEVGFADELYTNPKSAYTKKLIKAIPGKNL
ncbi:MAG: ABC transporter ATP-binding protein [Bacteroidales bacterium]|nr:ABC transporter ATP-binding protein [Bacteroidales bacterium]MDD3892335.1 ABC transporter ATP-binding protein [Bacteroidales bacterium]